MAMKIAVCDDSRMDRELIIELLHRYFYERHIDYDVAQFCTGDNFIYDIEEGEQYDLLMLGIYIGAKLGIETAKKARELGYSGDIIFLSAASDFAIEGYELDAAGYLLKPIDYKRFTVVMDRLLEEIGVKKYTVRYRNGIVRIPYDEIVYVDSSNTKCTIHRADGSKYVVYKKLDTIQEELNDERFLRCHQSYLVNMGYISQADKEFMLSTGDIVLIRQRGLKEIKQAYMDYIAKYGHIDSLR